MTNRLEINWKLDGFVDEQRYYCSENPIDINNLQIPKAILLGDIRTYTDINIEVGKTYYVAVGSVKNSVEKLSDIKIVSISEFQIDLKVDAGVFVNSGRTHLDMTWVGSPFFSSDFFTTSALKRLNVSSNSAFNFGSDDFEISFNIKKFESTRYSCLLGGVDYSSNSYTQFGFDNNSLYFGSAVGGFGSNLTATNVITLNEYHNVSVKRTGDIFELLVDDIVVASKTLAAGTTFNFNRNNAGTTLFGVSWDESAGFVGDVKSFTLKR